MLDIKTRQSSLSKSNRNSKHLKKRLSHYLLFQMNYPVVIDEYKYMDIFGIRRSGYTVEFEIKVTKSDLKRELDIIHNSDKQISKYENKDWKKYRKHSRYITGYQDEKTIIPNEFCFYVPDYLVDYALDGVVGTPYGVAGIGKYEKKIDFMGEERWLEGNYHVFKKPKKIHINKFDENNYKELSHLLSFRSRLFN